MMDSNKVDTIVNCMISVGNLEFPNLIHSLKWAGQVVKLEDSHPAKTVFKVKPEERRGKARAVVNLQCGS
jgi:hypothetical protein